MSPRIVRCLIAFTMAIASCSGGSEASPATTEESVAVEATTTTAAAPTTTGPAAIEGCAGLPTGITDYSLGAGGVDYSVRVYVPTSFSGVEMPVVLNWHGLGSSGLEQLALSNYEVLAEAEGFVVAHATGVPDPSSGRNSWELIDDQDPNRDDLEFADALIDDLIGRWCADSNRVYSTGMSNGGFFTARLVCERAHRIAAAVSVAGTSHQPDCAPTRAVPYRAYHGTSDELVPFDGSGESTLLEGIDDVRLAEFFEQVVPEEFGEFASAFGCALDPAVVAVSAEVTQHDYQGCDVPMSFVEIADGGHTWPGSPLGPLLVDSLGYTTPDVSATVDGWAFMRQHRLDG